MADVVNARAPEARSSRPAPAPRFWAVDKVILGYLAFTTILVVGWWDRVPYAGILMACHGAAAILIVLEVFRPSRFSRIFRHWYPLPYVAACYKEMSLLIPAIRGSAADDWLVRVDYGVWGAHPTVWLERLQSPAFTEFLQFAYTLFVPAVLLVAVVLWRRRQYEEFQYYAFLIALGFLVSYVGYLLVPARGPRFVLEALHGAPLRGLWLYDAMRVTLDRLESAHYDCFPSGHTELTILAAWGSRLISRPVFKVYLTYTPMIFFATVYLRYHYSVDVLAGAMVAGALILTAPAAYRKLS